LALKKDWRLKKGKIFDTLAQKGRREVTPLLKIWWLEGNGLVAVRVSKKISKLAVTRNKIRRWMWEELRSSRGEWRDKEMVVIIREPIEVENKNQLVNEWRQIIKKWEALKK